MGKQISCFPLKIGRDILLIQRSLLELLAGEARGGLSLGIVVLTTYFFFSVNFSWFGTQVGYTRSIKSRRAIATSIGNLSFMLP